MLVTAARPRGPIGPHQLQAAVAALHDEAQSPEATDWPQIAALCDVLLRLDDNQVVAPNHAVAISMGAGPRAGLELVQRLGTDLGSAPIVASTRSAARVPTNLQQQRYLNRQVASPAGPVGHLTVTSRTTPASRESWASASTGSGWP